MNKNQQNCIIARAIGWTTGKDRGGAWVKHPGGPKSERFHHREGDDLLAMCCEDFTSSLDLAAVAEAFILVNDELSERYLTELGYVTLLRQTGLPLTRAPSEVRIEALVRLLEKWTD